MMKKRLAVLLCGAMLLGTGSVAFAEENTDAQATEAEASDESAEEEAVEVPDAAKDSYDKLQEAEKTLKTTDDHLMMEAPLSFDVPKVDGDAAYCEDNYEETDANHWHYKEYLDWDEANDAKFPESPADGQEGKKVILIVHGAHAWTTCYTEAFQKACDAVGMEVTVYDPNWDQGNQDSYIDQAINEHPDAIALIPLSADHAPQQFKKITDAGIPAFCVNTPPEAEAMNYIISYTGPNDWYQMRTLADMLGEKMEGKGGVAYITHNVGGSPYYARCYGPMTELAEKYPDRVRAIVGVHPSEIANWTDDLLDRLSDLTKSPLVVGWGEIGLDYHYADGTPHEIMVYTMNAPYRDQLLPVSSRYNAVVMQGCLDAGISPQQCYDADEKYRKAYKARAAPVPKKHTPER